MKRAERAARRMTTTIIPLTGQDLCPPERLILREAVPECPSYLIDGVVDVGNQRWRFREGRLITYIRFLPPEQYDPGDIPWAAFWSA